MDHRCCLIQIYQLTDEETEPQRGPKVTHLPAEVTEAVYSPTLFHLSQTVLPRSHRKTL